MTSLHLTLQSTKLIRYFHHQGFQNFSLLLNQAVESNDECKKRIQSGMNLKVKEKTIRIFLKLLEDLQEVDQWIQDHHDEIWNQLQPIYIKRIHSVLQIPKPRYFNTKSFPEMVRKHIDTYALTDVEFGFSLYDRKFKLHFVLEGEASPTIIKRLQQSILHIILWLGLLNKHAGTDSKSCSKTLTFYFYFTSMFKTLPENNIEVLNQHHVNSAFTSTCSASSEIIIFRKEEWFKVLIHETFHNFALDFSGMNNHECHQIMKELFPVKSEINLFEAYTEFWAETLNVLIGNFLFLKEKKMKERKIKERKMIAQRKKTATNQNTPQRKIDYNEKDKEIFLKNSFLLMELERSYSFFQMVKVLHFMGLRYYDLYSNTRQSVMLREIMYKEKTNVLSYYVIKTILISDYGTFMEWCDHHHSSLLNFKKTKEHQLEFCKYIAQHYQTSTMLKGVMCSEEMYYSELKKKKLSQFDEFLRNTMRMTLFEHSSF